MSTQQTAMGSLGNNQAAFQANLMTLEAQTSERFARIESELAAIRAILVRHEQLLEALPEVTASGWASMPGANHPSVILSVHSVRAIFTGPKNPWG